MRDQEYRKGYGAREVSRRLGEGASFSGRERNHLFLNRGANGFTELSGISGVDHPADGRAFAILDYDRDGWLDFVVVNANAPWVQLFRNQIGNDPGVDVPGMVALRLMGGNRTANPSPAWSSRDGYGAVVTVELDDMTLVREHRAGEGLAAQNSAVMVIGVGDQEIVRRITVRWPSGRVSQMEDLPVGSQVVVLEDVTIADPESRSAYRRPVDARQSLPIGPSVPDAKLLPLRGVGDEQIRVYVTVATWCEACRDELGELRHLRSMIPPHEMGLYGVPVDPKEDAKALFDWVSLHRPAYRMLTELRAEELIAVKRLVLETLKVDAIPASIVTDSRGRVLETRFGAPSVSDIRRLLTSTPHRSLETM